MFRAFFRSAIGILVTTILLSSCAQDASSQIRKRPHIHRKKHHYPRAEVQKSMRSVELMHDALRLPKEDGQFQRSEGVFVRGLHIDAEHEKDIAEVSANWEVIATALNRLHDSLLTSNPENATPATGGADPEVRNHKTITGQLLQDLDEDRLQRLQVDLLARSQCADLLHLMDSAPKAQQPSLSSDAEVGAERSNQKTLEPLNREEHLWCEEAEKQLSSHAPKSESEYECIRSHKHAIAFINNILSKRTIPSKSEHDTVISESFSKEFQVAFKTHQIFQHFMLECLSNNEIEKFDLQAAERELRDLGWSSDDRSRLWSWCAKACLWLGKPQGVRDFLSLGINEEQMQELDASIDSMIKSTPLLFTKSPSNATSGAQVIELSYAQSLSNLSREKDLILGNMATRLGRLALAEAPSIAQRLRECSKEIDADLLSLLESIGTENSQLRQIDLPGSEQPTEPDSMESQEVSPTESSRVDRDHESTSAATKDIDNQAR